MQTNESKRQQRKPCKRIEWPGQSWKREPEKKKRSREDSEGNRVNKRVEKAAEKTVQTNELNDLVSLGNENQRTKKRSREDNGGNRVNNESKR